jgi:hypothetical protein
MVKFWLPFTVAGLLLGGLTQASAFPSHSALPAADSGAIRSCVSQEVRSASQRDVFQHLAEKRPRVARSTVVASAPSARGAALTAAHKGKLYLTPAVLPDGGPGAQQARVGQVGQLLWALVAEYAYRHAAT